MQQEAYNHKTIEKKWQKYWDEHQTFKTDVWDFSNVQSDRLWLPFWTSSCFSTALTSNPTRCEVVI